MAQDTIDRRTARPARWGKKLSGGRVRCELCPRRCELAEGQRGLCFVRGNLDGALVTTTWGRSSGFCVDPIEKKPLNHFLPGTPVLSFGTAGCNLTCRYCQNSAISKSRSMDTLAAPATPEAIAQAAVHHGARSVAFTYNDPVVFAEYALDVAAACRARGLKTVAVTAAYLEAQARHEFFAGFDAANVDLKALDEGFYRTLCSAQLTPVLDTLRVVHHHTPTWLEITCLVIPGHNDADAQIQALAAWIARELSPDVPLHLSAFHPAWRMLDVPATPLARLQSARRLAQAEGLRHVYTGNVHGPEGDTTWCAGCGALLIERDWYELKRWGLAEGGRCAHCGTVCPGHFEAHPGHWGRRRQPVRVGA